MECRRDVGDKRTVSGRVDIGSALRKEWGINELGIGEEGQLARQMS